MDLSKLPKLSQTERPGQPITDESPPAAQSPHPTYSQSANPASPSAEAWISIAVGAILLLVAPTMLKYLSSRLFGTPFAPFLDANNTEVPYPRVYPQFLSDLCVTIFAVVLILDGIAIALIRRPGILLIIFLLTVLATLMNLLLVICTTANYGVPLISAIAVIIGGYMAIQQFATLRRLR